MKQLFTDAMITPSKNTPKTLLTQLRHDYPKLHFVEATQFSWNSAERRILYPAKQLSVKSGEWALLHELGHATLSHTDYTSDFDLLRIECAAWEQAHTLAKTYGITIDDEYVQDCLDSYRDWLHLRSTCPTCYERCLQTNKYTYRCHNCGTVWRVSRSRLCRPYRRKGNLLSH